jgi:hypothetical protein
MSLDFNAPSITFNETKLYKLDFDKYSPSAEVQNIIQHIWPRDCTSLEKLQNRYHFEIETIHKVKNEFRAKMWSVVEDEMREKGYVKHTFMHGTKTDALDTIFKFGFNPSFGTRAMIGKGVYCSPKLLEALGYGYNIIVCEVFLGNTGVGEGKEGLPPAALGFDSTQTRDGSIVCIGDPGKFMMSVALVRFRRNYHQFKLPVAGGAAASVKVPVVPVAQLAAVPVAGLPGFGQALVSNAPLVSSAAASGAGGASDASGASGASGAGGAGGAGGAAGGPPKTKQPWKDVQVHDFWQHTTDTYYVGDMVFVEKDGVPGGARGVISKILDVDNSKNRAVIEKLVHINHKASAVVKMQDPVQVASIAKANKDARIKGGQNPNNRWFLDAEGNVPLNSITDPKNNKSCIVYDDMIIVALNDVSRPLRLMKGATGATGASNVLSGPFGGSGVAVVSNGAAASSQAPPASMKAPVAALAALAAVAPVAPVAPVAAVAPVARVAAEAPVPLVTKAMAGAAQSAVPVTGVQDKGKGPAIEVILISDSEDDDTGSPLKRTRIGDV